jgi:DNA-binding response OmpR family regulator
LKTIPVILLTSLFDSSDIIRWLETMSDDYMIKPYDETTLLIAIEKWLKAPDLSGKEETKHCLEMLRRIKADDRTRKTPVVVLTSSNEERDIVESYYLGVNSYIVKPVDCDKFLDYVGELGLYWLLLNKPFL